MYDWNDEADAERFVRTYADLILRLCLSHGLSRADAQDICQELFLKLLAAQRTFTSEEHEKAWLLRVTVNHCKNHLASAWFRKRADLDEGIPALDNAELEVVSAVAALPAKYRAVVHLYYFEGYSTKEIAEILHSRPNTVSSRLSRARALLAKALKEEIV